MYAAPHTHVQRMFYVCLPLSVGKTHAISLSVNMDVNLSDGSH